MERYVDALKSTQALGWSKKGLSLIIKRRIYIPHITNDLKHRILRVTQMHMQIHKHSDIDVRLDEMSWPLLSIWADSNYEILYVAGQQQQQLTIGILPVQPQKAAICIVGLHWRCWNYTRKFIAGRLGRVCYVHFNYVKTCFPMFHHSASSEVCVANEQPRHRSRNAECLHLIGLTRKCAYMRGPINIHHTKCQAFIKMLWEPCCAFLHTAPPVLICFMWSRVMYLLTNECVDESRSLLMAIAPS